MFKNDGGGEAISCNDMKLMWSTSSWGTRLSQIAKVSGMISIATYSIPDVEKVCRIFEKRPTNIRLLAHLKFVERAREIKEIFPDIEVRVHGATHAKLVLIEPKTVYVSSENFVKKKRDWFEASIGLHSKEAYTFYCRCFDDVWQVAIAV